jgi:trehalose 2-sulfotransferase
VTHGEGLAGDPQPLDEASLSTAAHDCPPSDGPTRRLIICTTPRSGSYLLARLLIRAGLGVPHEYLNTVNAGPIEARARGSGPPLTHAQYLDWLDHHRTAPNGVFAAKVHWPQLDSDPLALQRWFHSSPPADLVFLHRRRLSAQAHSLRSAASSGVWDSSGRVSTTPPRGLRGIGFDDLDRLTYRIIYWNSMWRLSFEAWGQQPLEIAYEDLVADQQGTVAHIAATLGVSAVVPEPEPRGQNTPAPSEEARQRIQRYAQSWVPPAANPTASSRRLARALAVDLVRQSARRTRRRLGRSAGVDDPGEV